MKNYATSRPVRTYEHVHTYLSPHKNCLYIKTILLNMTVIVHEIDYNFTIINHAKRLKSPYFVIFSLMHDIFVGFFLIT